MFQELIKWDVYEISAEQSSLNGVKLRGRIRKFGLVNNINILAENTEIVSNGVRFALLHGTDVIKIEQFLKSIIPDSCVELKLENISNPVLSKLKVNIESRYKI
jgi:hypothetical protein